MQLRVARTSLCRLENMFKGAPLRHPDIQFRSIISIQNLFDGKDGAGRGNRTLLASLEDWNFTTKLYPQWKECVDNCSAMRCASSAKSIFLHFVDKHLRPVDCKRAVGRERNANAGDFYNADLLRDEPSRLRNSSGCERLNRDARNP
jgi:hypothetical protein